MFSQLQTRLGTKWLLLLVLLLGVRWPSLTAVWYTNQATLQMVGQTDCAPAWRVCTFTDRLPWFNHQQTTDPALWAKPLARLQRAKELDKTNQRVSLHLATLLFTQGQEQAAAALLAESGWATAVQPLWPTDEPYNQPRLIMPLDRYAYYVLEGYWAVAAADWATAVDRFRLGLGYAQEQTTPQLRADFYRASAAAYGHSTDGRELTDHYLAGKYELLSGQAAQAAVTLQDGWGQEMPPRDKAWTAVYLGRALAEQGDWSAAIETHQAGWQADPQVRENGLRLWRLWQQTGAQAEAQAIARDLVTMGPAFPNGRWSPTYKAPEFTSIPSGYSFVGYDVDPQTIAHGAPLELYLWWQVPSESQPMTQNFIDLGAYRVTHQQVANLVPNAGFEWGSYADELAIGWPSRYYAYTPASAYISETQREGQPTWVALSNNKAEPSTGWASIPLLLDPQSWYLMAGWVNDNGNGQIARVCERTLLQPGSDYYVYDAHKPPPRPAHVWIHVADLAPAFGQNWVTIPQRCQFLLLNRDAPGSQAMWDDLILARIDLP